MINDIELYISQSHITAITTFVDYYGLKEWPGLEQIQQSMNHDSIAQQLNDSAKAQVSSLYPNSSVKFIPYMAMYEFEALLFSEADILAASLGAKVEQVTAIIKQCHEPERINNSKQTAPSKRLNQLNVDGDFGKTTQGISIAKQIGIDTIRNQCPLFDQWLVQLEACAK